MDKHTFTGKISGGFYGASEMFLTPPKTTVLNFSCEGQNAVFPASSLQGNFDNQTEGADRMARMREDGGQGGKISGANRQGRTGAKVPKYREKIVRGFGLNAVNGNIYDGAGPVVLSIVFSGCSSSHAEEEAQLSGD